MVQRANGPISPSVVYLGVVTGRSIGTSMDWNVIWQLYLAQIRNNPGFVLLWYVGLDHVWNLSKPQTCSRQSFRSFLTRRAMSGDVSHFFRCWINANDTLLNCWLNCWIPTKRYQKCILIRDVFWVSWCPPLRTTLVMLDRHPTLW